MKIVQKRFASVFVLASLLIFLCGCLTPAKMDRYVASQYGGQIPKVKKSKSSDISVTTTLKNEAKDISLTKRKTSDLLPLVFYWSFDYRHTCTLNPEIATNTFTNIINTTATRELKQKLNGRKLELNVDEVPTSFAIVDKAKLIWVIVYVIDIHKIYVEPDFKNLVVSYNLIENDNTVKTGTITVNSDLKNRNIRFFQTWRSSASEFIMEYSASLSSMTKEFIKKMEEEI